MTERDEQNRKIAEWLGWKPNPGRTRWHSPDCQKDIVGSCGGKVPDFFTDESANAMVLEKLVRLGCCITVDADGVLITCAPDLFSHRVVTLVDYKIGWTLEIQRLQVYLAALRLIEEEQK